jgi:hypothetical protein
MQVPEFKMVLWEKSEVLFDGKAYIKTEYLWLTNGR